MNHTKSGNLFARLAGILFVLYSLEGMCGGGTFLVESLIYFNFGGIAFSVILLISPLTYFISGVLLFRDKKRILLLVAIGVRAAIDIYSLIYCMLNHYMESHDWVNVVVSLTLFASILLFSLPPQKGRLFMAKATCFLPVAMFFLDEELGTFIELFSATGFGGWLFLPQNFCLLGGLLFVGLWIWNESTFMQKMEHS